MNGNTMSRATASVAPTVVVGNEMSEVTVIGGKYWGMVVVREKGGFVWPDSVSQVVYD